MSAIIVTLIIVLLAMQLSSIVPPRSVLNSQKVDNETEMSISIEPETEIAVETTAVPKINAQIKTYTSHGDRIKINYPDLVGIDDNVLLTRINEKLYDNAISVVKLYPISTALQRLNISCDVKYVNDDYITVVYEGRVIGDQASGTNVNLKGSAIINNKANSSSNNNNAKIIDPYLDGFVDPLSSYQGIIPPQTIDTQIIPIEITVNSNAVEQSPSVNKAGTSDSGPTVADNITPTAERYGNVVSDNAAGSNPTGPATILNNQITSGGVYNGAPITSNGYTNSNNAPVYGQTGTSISASTINQKIFYTNTINLKTGENVTLKDYDVDFEKLAKYARSKDVEFINIDESNRSQVRSYINKTVLSKLREQLENNSDFKDENMTTWPKHFSYKDEDGNIYFSIKLSSRLGNYAIIKYNQ